VLAQRRDHPGLQPTSRLRVDRGLDRLVADQPGRIIGVLGLQFAHNLLGRLALVDQFAAHKGMQPAAGDKLSPPPAELAARLMPRPALLRAPPSCAQ
jgi:hypothetical protein